LLEKLKLAASLETVPDGPESIVVSGGVVYSGRLDGTPGGAGLILALCTDKQRGRHPDVRWHDKG